METRVTESSWKLVRLFRCITGPQLRRMYLIGRSEEGTPYIPNKLERYADNVILAANLAFIMAYHISPFYLAYYILRHGFPTLAGLLSTLKVFSLVPFSFSLAYIARGVGRFQNHHYTEFLTSLSAAQKWKGKFGPTEARLTRVDGYDFEMWAHPIIFKYDQSVVKPRGVSSPVRKGFLKKAMSLPMSTARYVAMSLFGRRLVYPGSTAAIQLAMASFLSKGRAKLIRKYDGFRGRLLASDGNCIDCMFVDRRSGPGQRHNGNKLVICCEGNAAFYEAGMMEIPLSAGYSVLGWNHPGFADSSGLPYPDQEFNAADVVVRYAVTELGFTFDDIILYAWSIGGYCASCMAMSYPDIGAVILDATFDDVAALAKWRSPPRLASFVHGMVRQYMNLNIAEQMCYYPGPITIARRERDEMMSVNNKISSNRGNYLLVKILQTRYPNLTSAESLRELWAWLKAPDEYRRSEVEHLVGMNPSHCAAMINSYISDKGPNYPWLIGDNIPVEDRKRLLVFLATQYMVNYDSTHCQLLPVELLRVPSSRGNLVL